MRRCLMPGAAAMALGVGPAAAGEVTFTRPPAAKVVGNKVEITFSVSAPTDAAVWVEGAQGRAVRHLAAGALGQNAPAPLVRGLEQRLVWDGTDDAGQAVDVKACRVRVGLGLKAAFDRLIGWSPYTIGDVKALAVGPEGRLYCLAGYGVPSLVRFDREGKYERTLLPHDPRQPAAALAGVPTLRRPDGVAVPLLANMRDPYGPVSALGFTGLRESGSMVVGREQVYLAGPKAAHLVPLRLDGAIPETLKGPDAVPAEAGGVQGLALSPEGATLYASGKSAVYRLDPSKKDAAPVALVQDLNAP